MNKRTVKIGSYDTALHGWTLTSCVLSAPEIKSNYVDKPGGDGSWDLSTAMTDGIPRYKNRTLTLKFECSKDTRTDRENLLNNMVDQLDGFEWPIVLPDRPTYYLKGRVHIAENQSSPAYAAITITANVEPWFYAERETIVELDAPITASTETAIFQLWNNGRRVVSPLLTVDGKANLSFKGNRTTLTTGTYEWPALQLWPGMSEIGYLGEGTLTFTYREAVLR